MKKQLKYEEVTKIERSEAIRRYEENNIKNLGRTMVRVAFYEPDYKWAQEYCLRLCEHTDPETRAVAVTCLGHIARIHGVIDTDAVRPVLKKLSLDPVAAGRVKEAAADIRIFAFPDFKLR